MRPSLILQINLWYILYFLNFLFHPGNFRLRMLEMQSAINRGKHVVEKILFTMCRSIIPKQIRSQKHRFILIQPPIPILQIEETQEGVEKETKTHP